MDATGQVQTVQTTGYDGDGHAVRQVDGNGAGTVSSFDPLGREVATTNPVEIAATTNIDVHLTTEALGAHGTGQLSGLELRSCTTGETETVPAAALFILTGAELHTAWLPDAIARDARLHPHGPRSAA
jgi:hypothetical protein